MALDTKFWAKYFKVYDVLNMVIPYQELLDTIVKELEIKEGDLVLDAGCGTGNLAMKIKEKGAKVIGIDFSKEALEVYKKKDPNAEVMVHDLTKPLPFPDNYFDKIACNNVLYAIDSEKRENLIREFGRVLKNHALIVTANPHINVKPIAIYKEHIKKDFRKRRAMVFMDIITMIVPTIKMFHYNSKIKKAHKGGDYKFFKYNEQSQLLEKFGLNNIQQEISIYAGQDYLAKGINVKS